VFHLLKGPEREDHVLYSSHAIWRSYEDFEAWTKSEQFRKVHAGAGTNKPLIAWSAYRMKLSALM
jgi:heme-degrading monooxygenase HmoA